MPRSIIVFILLLFLSAKISAQKFGGNPPSLQWKQINSDTARVIFPAGLEKEAADVSVIVHELNRVTQSTIGNELRKVNIVLQNQTITSNGYVSLGPFRSEFFLTPRQNSFELGSLPWHKTLALHEYRHVQQFNNFRKGLSRLIYYAFGEQGQALANTVAVPDWFWEGDAVYQETLLSRQGRGRLPYFFNPYRSLWSAEKNYSWMKLRNGSYRDLVPDHYRLGYLMVSYGREKYGNDIWKNITGDAARFKGPFYPFQRALKEQTGQNFKNFRKNAFNYYKNELKNTADSASSFGKKQMHFAGDEEFPQWINESELVYVKSSYKKIPSFYTRNIISGEEEKIKVKDISPDNYFSYRNGKIVYAAYTTDARWGWSNYGVIRVFDIKTGKQNMLTRRTKYFSPDISEDGKQIIAVHSDPSGRNSIHLLDGSSGTVLIEIPNKEGFIFTYPKFYKGDSIITAIRNTQGEMALASFDIKTGNYNLLVPFGMDVIGYPTVNKDTIAFTMSQKGQDKLFVLASGRTYLFHPEWENNSTGDYHLTIKNGNYAWTTYTAAGFHLVKGKGVLTEFSNSKKTEPANKKNLVAASLFQPYPVEKFKKSYRLFNFHSWRPYISDPEYSYSLIGENIINTFQSELFITYNRNEKFKETGASFAYGGLFPVLRASGSYTFDRSFNDSSRVVNWNEFNANIGASLPLTFTGGTYTQNVNLSATFNSRQVYYTGASKLLFENKRFNFSDLSASFTNQQIKAIQNIYPRFAQTLSARYRFILNKYTAYQLGLSGALYFPGLFTNHSLVLQGAYQLRDTLQEYNFSNTFAFSRGYQEINFPRMWRMGVNYHFPIAYPDFGFANIIYLLRLRGNAFFDYSKTKSLRTAQQYAFRTAGMEIYVDSKWWNQLPVSFGIRYSRLLDNEIIGMRPNQWEFILPVNLLGR